MQPFLSGEATLAWLLITLTLLLFTAAGDEHPYEPSYHHRKVKVPPVGTAAERSSVEMDNRPPVQAKELVVKLEGLKQQQQQQQRRRRRRAEPEVNQRVVKRRRTEVVVKGDKFYEAPHPENPTSSYLSLTSCLRSPRNLQVLAALLSHQSLHMMNIPSVLVGKSGVVDISWSLSLGGLPIGLVGLPLMEMVRGGQLLRQPMSLQCRGTKKSLSEYVGHVDEKEMIR